MSILQNRINVFVVMALFVCLVARPATAQISTDLIEKHRAELQKQSTDPEMKRERGTQPQDWVFALPEGVTSRQVIFYSDGTPCYGRLFFPKGFSNRGSWPAVVVGHGINAQAVGIEKYAARFAERGLVAMAIDYRTYGYSGGDLSLLEPDTSNDSRAVWEKEARIRIKRTNLNNFRETEDFRAAISFIQTEPGVDPERIGIWGSSNGASVVLMVAALDARVKAIVAQVGGAGGLGASGPVAIPPQMIEDGIRRARAGQGAEVDGGFSFRSKIDLWSNQVNREFRPAAMLDHIPETTKILWLPVEKDELIQPRGVQAASKAFKGTSQIIEIPYVTHFQAYSFAAFEAGSNLAADWFLKYLSVSAASGSERGSSHKPTAKASLATARGTDPIALQRTVAVTNLPEGVTAKEVSFYSEGIRCYGKLFLPGGHSAESKAPAVALAPGWGETSASVESYAARFAARGLAAMTLDYRGWGRSGGFIEIVDQVKSDDRLRFSQMTARIRIRRKRLLPQAQILDIRNALYFLQGEPGVDRSRLGVWGAGAAGDHAVVIAATDARVKAIVAHAPLIEGKDAPGKASAPVGELLLAEQKRSRTGQLPARTPDAETRLALAEYHPFRFAEQIPEKTAALFVMAEKDAKANNDASKQIKGTTKVISVSGSQAGAGSAFDTAANAAAEWFLKHL